MVKFVAITRIIHHRLKPTQPLKDGLNFSGDFYRYISTRYGMCASYVTPLSRGDTPNEDLSLRETHQPHAEDNKKLTVQLPNLVVDRLLLGHLSSPVLSPLEPDSSQHTVGR